MLKSKAALDLLNHYRSVFRHVWQLRHALDHVHRYSHETEFLPAALALQETPVSPTPQLAICFELDATAADADTAGIDNDLRSAQLLAMRDAAFLRSLNVQQQGKRQTPILQIPEGITQQQADNERRHLDSEWLELIASWSVWMRTRSAGKPNCVRYKLLQTN